MNELTEVRRRCCVTNETIDPYLAEARMTVAELTAIAEHLTRSDQRFVASWVLRLDRLGDQTRVGSNRIQMLRRVRASYPPDRALHRQFAA